MQQWIELTKKYSSIVLYVWQQPLRFTVKTHCRWSEAVLCKVLWGSRWCGTDQRWNKGMGGKFSWNFFIFFANEGKTCLPGLQYVAEKQWWVRTFSVYLWRRSLLYFLGSLFSMSPASRITVTKLNEGLLGTTSCKLWEEVQVSSHAHHDEQGGRELHFCPKTIQHKIFVRI